MHLYALRFPGDQLNEPRAPEAQSLINLIREMLDEACVALELYNEFQAQSLRPVGIGCPSDADLQRANEIFRERLTWDPEFQMMQAVREAHREHWRAGRGRPLWYIMGRERIAQKSFVYALDTARAAAELLAKTPSLEARVRPHYDALATVAPNLREVRNSAHHEEDRVRMRKGHGKPITPVATSLDTPVGQVLVDGTCANIDFGGQYAYTMADGRTGVVEVSAATLDKVAACVQAIANALRWTGRAQYAP
jgi:hypothetical protein